MVSSLVFAVLLAAASVQAAPPLETRQAITTLVQSQISSFKPFTFFASAAYCQPAALLTWSCGANCNANPGFLPTASGGDGTDTPFWYVGFSPALNTVIVAHEGTDPSSLVSDLIDVDFFLEPLNPALFPGVPASVEVHNGFAASQASTAPAILAAVQQTLTAHNVHSVTLVGHSLGAALTLLDSVYLPLHLGSGITFRTIGYGLPRVGNQQFANYVDAHLSLTHINNREDPVPILPGRFLGFVHPSGELHIQDSLAWDACPGQDNPSTLCIVGDVPNIFESDESDHDGPYDGVEMGC